jgi:hypothetical protein
MAWMAQFLPRLSDTCKQALERVNHGLPPDGLAVAGEAAAFCNRRLAALAPSKAYGAHWLIR